MNPLEALYLPEVLALARRDFELELALFVKGSSLDSILMMSAKSRLIALEQKVSGLPHRKWF
jgi:hypothetical protein